MLEGEKKGQISRGRCKLKVEKKNNYTEFHEERGGLLGREIWQLTTAGVGDYSWRRSLMKISNQQKDSTGMRQVQRTTFIFWQQSLDKMFRWIPTNADEEGAVEKARIRRREREKTSEKEEDGALGHYHNQEERVDRKDVLKDIECRRGWGLNVKKARKRKKGHFRIGRNARGEKQKWETRRSRGSKKAVLSARYAGPGSDIFVNASVRSIN